MVLKIRRYPNEGAVERTDFTFEKKYDEEAAPLLIRQGFQLKQRFIRDVKKWFWEKRKNGKLVEELPVIEREIDLYVTGYYRIRSGKYKGQVLETHLRIPIRISYVPRKELMDKIRQDIQEKAIDKFKTWAELETFGDIWDEIDVKFETPEEEE